MGLELCLTAKSIVSLKDAPVSSATVITRLHLLLIHYYPPETDVFKNVALVPLKGI